VQGDAFYFDSHIWLFYRSFVGRTPWSAAGPLAGLPVAG